MTIKRFEDALMWQKARTLNQALFKEFENVKSFTFKDQILRAGLSIMNNIAEGFERNTDKEFRYFLYIARGSNAEVRSMLYSALDNGYINTEKHAEIFAFTNETGRLLTGFIKSLNCTARPSARTRKTTRLTTIGL